MLNDLPVQISSRSYLLDYPVDSLTLQDAVTFVLQSLLSEEGLHHVVPINANKLWLAERNPELKKIVQRAELVIPEYAVVWACRTLRRPLRAHVGGIMLLKALLPFLEREHIPVYFFGAKDSVVELMKSRMRTMYPCLAVAGMHSGYLDAEQEEEIVNRINQSGAAVLFVAMGTPKQELWIEKHRRALAVRVAMGVGGSFDVLAGIKSDAPQWLRHGGEWIYRLAQDPRNLTRRYLTTNPWFVYRVLRERMFANAK